METATGSATGSAAGAGAECPRCGSTDTTTGGPHTWNFCGTCRRYWDDRSYEEDT